MLSVLVSIIAAVSFRWPKLCGALLNIDLLCVLLGIPDRRLLACAKVGAGGDPTPALNHGPPGMRFAREMLR